MNRAEALVVAQHLADHYLDGRRAWGQVEEDVPNCYLLGTWEPDKGDEETEGALAEKDGTVCWTQSVRWQGKSWYDAVRRMSNWLESWDKWRKGGPTAEQLKLPSPQG